MAVGIAVTANNRWSGPRCVVGWAPRALGDICARGADPGLSSGRSTSPLGRTRAASAANYHARTSDMVKATISVLVGFVIWLVAATLGNLLLRALIPTYIAAEAVMTFTLPMLLARLAVGFVSSLVAGFACSYIAT